MRKKTSALWKWFKLTEDNYAVCGICKRRFSYSSSTSNLKKHLARKHAKVYNADFLKDSSSVTSETITHITADELIDTAEISTNDDLNDPLELDGTETLHLNSSVGDTIYDNIKDDTSQRSAWILRNSKRNKTKSSYEGRNFGLDNRREHELDEFGTIVGYQLKQLPLEAGFEVQMKIHELLMQERIKALKNSASE